MLHGPILGVVALDLMGLAGLGFELGYRLDDDVLGLGIVGAELPLLYPELFLRFHLTDGEPDDNAEVEVVDNATPTKVQVEAENELRIKKGPCTNSPSCSQLPVTS